MHKQLVLLHNAVAAYFSGNAAALEGTIKQFNVKVDLIYWYLNALCEELMDNFVLNFIPQLKSPNSVSGSWLEK